MTKPHPDARPDDLRALDARATVAAEGLRAHVRARLDPDAPVALASTPTHTRAGRRRSLLSIAAAAVLIAGSLAVLSQRTDDSRTRLDVDENGEALPDFDAGVLRPLGPHDGKDSVQLPVTADPTTGLHDGDEVSVASPGFEPGERVGIVQCAREAGGDSPQTRGGVDGCYVGGVQYADADADGRAAGSIKVRRVLTTPLTGTVDCAAEANRCLVAMGALNDYDRSGGHGIEFAADGEPIELPTVTVTPSEDLADGDVVHVVADGLVPDAFMQIEVCSSDPAACWQTGAPTEIDASQEGGRYIGVGLPVDGHGHLEGDVKVWRYLPGGEPGTYVDCAVSRCSLRLYGDTAPPTVPLHFTPGGSAPVPPALSVVPADDLAPGDEVAVRGKGFVPGSQIQVSLCASPVAAPPMAYMGCGSSDGGDLRVEGDGTFALGFDIPELGSMGGYSSEDCSAQGPCSATTACADGCTSATAVEAGPIRCDGVTTVCYITADVYQDGSGQGPPVFPAVPVKVTFR